MAKDQLSPDKLMDVVKSHSEKVLFPRLENRFGDSTDFQQDTARPMTSLSLSQSLGPSSTGPRARTSASTRQLRPKSPSSGVHLKVFSMDKLEESLTAIKVYFLSFTPFPLTFCSNLLLIWSLRWIHLHLFIPLILRTTFLEK